jgi:glycosyltransferase involved in cell wall biosynthesis
MKTNKFLIILAYYERPTMVLNALQSIKELEYDNFEVAFIDDGSKAKGELVVREHCADIIDKFKFHYIDNTPEDKMKNGGSIHGKYMNEAIQNSDADIVIVLCDDDALVPTYLTKLNKFFNSSNAKWCYSHVRFFNPETESYKDSKSYTTETSFNTANLNAYTNPIPPSCHVDGSQVAIRREAFEKYNIWYPFPQTKDCDRHIFEGFIKHLGLCPFSGCVGQYKGWFINQLGAKHLIGKSDFVI